MAPNEVSSLGARVGAVEQRAAVHEAVCEQRYKALDLKIMAIFAVQGAILLVILGGNTVVHAIQRFSSGIPHP